jgi:hypothetical protein
MSGLRSAGEACSGNPMPRPTIPRPERSIHSGSEATQSSPRFGISSAADFRSELRSQRRAMGGALYVSSCLFCHGVPGVDKGGNIPNLGYVDADVMANLDKAVLGTTFSDLGMPDFGEAEAGGRPKDQGVHPGHGRRDPAEMKDATVTLKQARAAISPLPPGLASASGTVAPAPQLREEAATKPDHDQRAVAALVV